MGHASSMSSATPAAFLSAMSITTTSASDLSATPRATVAPTLPAPPTTVTFRFMSAPSDDALSRRHEEYDEHEVNHVQNVLRDRRVPSCLRDEPCFHMLLMMASANSDVF